MWDRIVKKIPVVVDRIREDRVLDNMTIRDDIFSILEKHCTVIYYPLHEEKNSGFHMKRFIKEKLEDIVYINTAKPIAEQVFTAAHELGHVWEVAKQVMVELGETEVVSEELEERIVNRFAAELLMPEKEFVKTFKAYMEKVSLGAEFIKFDDLIRVVVMQMNDFMVPYEAVRRRLIETDRISKQTGDILKANEKDVLALVVSFSKEQNTILDRVTGKKTIPGLRDLVEKVERENLLDEYTICKMKKDFDLEELYFTDVFVKLGGEGEENEKK